MSTLTTFLFSMVLEVLVTIRQEKEIEEIHIGKEVMFADDMTLCIENPKDAISKILELISEYGKVTQ